ncbi:hypothetical protein ACF061_16550 [Streptomyces sp. NPDC015220]
MLFAETAHPYDDSDQLAQWAWRYGYFDETGRGQRPDRRCLP